MSISNRAGRHRAIFLDRDGVINRYRYNAEHGTVDSPGSPAEFEVLPGVPQAIRDLNALGFLTIVVSNQPGLAKGRFTQSLLDAMTHKMHRALRRAHTAVTAVYYCPHHPKGCVDAWTRPCDCRKPKVGLLLQAARDWNVDTRRSYMVGDGVVDLLAGQSVGATNIFVSPRKCYVCDELARHRARTEYFVPDLRAAAALIAAIEQKKEHTVAQYRVGCCAEEAR